MGIGAPKSSARVAPTTSLDEVMPRQQRARHVEEREQLVVPVERREVHQRGARGVADVGDVHSACQVPDQPAVDGAEGQFATLGPHASAGHMVEQPLDLGGGEVRVEHQSRPFAHAGLGVAGAQRGTAFAGAPVLPDDGVGDRRPGGTVPQDGRLALVGDADGRNITRRHPGLPQRRLRARELRRPNLVGVVLDPSGLRKDLPEFLLRRGDGMPGTVEQNGTRACGALVQRQYVSRCVACHFVLQIIAFRGQHRRTRSGTADLPHKTTTEETSCSLAG